MGYRCIVCVSQGYLMWWIGRCGWHLLIYVTRMWSQWPFPSNDNPHSFFLGTDGISSSVCETICVRWDRDVSVDTAICLYWISAHKAANASLSLFPMLCDVSLHMFCYDVAKMTSHMRSGTTNVETCPQKSCIADDFWIGGRVTPHSTLWKMG